MPFAFPDALASWTALCSGVTLEVRSLDKPDLERGGDPTHSGPRSEGSGSPSFGHGVGVSQRVVVLLSWPLAVTITLWLAPVFGAVLPDAIGVGNRLVDNDPP